MEKENSSHTGDCNREMMTRIQVLINSGKGYGEIIQIPMIGFEYFWTCSGIYISGATE